MHFQFEVAPPGPTAVPGNAAQAGLAETTALLSQILEAQREQTQLLRVLLTMQDSSPRWRGYIERWKTEFPEFLSSAKDTVRTLEQAFMRLMADLSDQIREEQDSSLDNDFTLGEFLERYSTRVVQLNNLMNLLVPLAEAAKAQE